MDTRGDGAPMTAHRRRTAISSYSETRTVWLLDESAAYIANGDDPESPDWPIETCDEELRRLRLAGFDTVACTEPAREPAVVRHDEPPHPGRGPDRRGA